MGYRFAWLAGLAAIALALLRLDRLVSDTATGLPWMLALVAAVILGALISWIALSYRIGGAGIAGANLLLFALAAVRIGAPEDAIAGVLPTWTTFETLQEELSLAIDMIRFGSPPVPPLAGLLVILAALFWALGGLLAWGLARGRPAVALVPPLLFYLQLATIDRLDPGPMWVASVLVLVAVSFLAVSFDERRQGGRIRSGPAAAQLPTTTSRLPLAFIVIPTVVAVSAMAVLADRIDEAGLVRWRRGGLGGGGIAAGVSFNLFAGVIQEGLVGDSDSEVFRARVEVPPGAGELDPAGLYFRLVTLDVYDGRHWFPGSSVAASPEEGEPWGNPQHVQAGGKIPAIQNVEIGALSMPVLPALAQPQGLESSTSIIEQSHRVREDGSVWIQVSSRPGYEYSVLSEVAVPDISALATIGGSLSPIFSQARANGAIDLFPRSSVKVDAPEDLEEFTQLPDDLHGGIGELAGFVTAIGTTDFERGILLERHFLDTGPDGFTYSTDTQGHGARDLADWLFDPLSPNYRTGYCEQFATAMAVMARTIGIPSRVVLGFTPGDVSGDVIIVREKHGHAWVELWIEDHGWVRFDPTPRADGQNAPTTMSSFVGFDPLEHIPPPSEDAAEGPDVETAPRPPQFEILDQPFEAVPPIVIPGTGIAIPRWMLIPLAGALLASIIPAVKWLRRRRRLERLRRGDITAAWEEITDRLVDLGSPVSAHQTPLEVAKATDTSLGPLAGEYGRTAYGPEEAPSAERVAVAERSFVATEAHLRNEYSWSQKAWSWIRPGSLRRRR